MDTVKELKDKIIQVLMEDLGLQNSGDYDKIDEAMDLYKKVVAMNQKANQRDYEIPLINDNHPNYPPGTVWCESKTA